MDKKEIIDIYAKKYMDNIKLYSDYNDSITTISDYNKWKDNLVERSKAIRAIFKENEEIIKSFKLLLRAGIDKEIADLLYDKIVTFNQEKMHDASVMILIINRLITFYESLDEIDYDKLINLNLIGALEEMEFFLRMDKNYDLVDPKGKYLKILSYKDHYKDIKTEKGRRGIFLAYYNIIGPLAEFDDEIANNIIKYYKDAIDFYNSDIVQSIDKDNESISDEIEYIKDTFVCDFYLFVENKNNEFFELIKDLEDDERPLVELVTKYYKNEITVSDMCKSLYELFYQYYGDKLVYTGDDDNLNQFCNSFDIALSLFAILKNSDFDFELKYQYINKIGFAVFDYISTVPYKDYTSYFDDISATLFEILLPFCLEFKYKEDLLSMLILRRQPMTYIHSIMVEKISVAIAKEILKQDKSLFNDLIELGYDNDDKIIEYIRNAAFYHDLGKCLTLGVINLQNRQLTDEEFKFIKMHPAKSIVLLNNDESFKKYYDVMLGHHRTYDGKGGYPLEFNNLESKYKSAIDLISIADSTDAATDILGRNYTVGKSFDVLLKELNEFKGTRYNPYMVDIINSSNELKEYLGELTGEKRVEVYYDVYIKILKNFSK